MNIGIIGLGLIGGSYGLAAKRSLPRETIFGTDRDPEHQKEALALGLVEKTLSEDQLSKMDLIIVAVPVDQTEQLFMDLLDQINYNCLVMDVGSTKTTLCQAL